MEQRIDSSSKALDGAGIDPAFIPGLTSPASAEPVGDRREEAASAEPAVDEGTEEEAEEPEGGEEAEASDGPVFEASDRRARIVADSKGVRLSLDDQACEFRWDEIGAVETEPARFGKRFTITVHTPDRRWYPIEIEATARALFSEWEEQLDAVLDAYFDDGAGGAEPEAEAKAD
ncbi:MAG: hypothetical protein HOY79_40210 [Streptomyces sp.]|nr:hypothetical protein [Streptomyces sp.]